MTDTSDERASPFFRRSFRAVDGLWFMKAEERLGFDAALEIDVEVWKVMPKIQARMMKAMTGKERGLEALIECLTTKLGWEGYAYEAVRGSNDQGFEMLIRECPWHRLLVKSGREALGERVGVRICGTEYSVWASEFGEGIRFELGDTICQGSPSCVLRFQEGEVSSDD